MASNMNLEFQILAQFQTLTRLNEELTKAKTALNGIAVTLNGEVNPAYAKQQAYVAALNSTIKNYNSLQAIQAKEMEAVWASLDKLNKAGAKAQEVEIRKTAAIQNNIAMMESYSKVQMVQQVAQTKVASGLQGTTQASSNAAMALLNLNYVIRDSPYFFNNFALGLLAVGNNLNPLIDSFMRAKVAAKEAGSTITKDLKMALVGGAGISIAFSVVVTAIQSYVFATSRAKDKTRSLTDEVKNLWSETYKTTKQWDEFILSLDKMSKSDVDESIKGLNKELDDVNITFMEVLSAGGNWVNTLDNIIDRTVKLIKLRDIAESKKEKEGIIGGGIIEEQEALVESYTILEKSAKIDSERLGWQKLRKEAQEKLNELLGKEKKTQEDITGEIHKQAKAMQVLMNVAGRGVYEGSDIRNLRGRGVQPSENRPIASLFEGAAGERMIDKMKEFNIALETGKIFANELGDALEQAFSQGKIALDRFMESLISAIAQMLILKAITSLFTLGLGGAAVAMVSGAATAPIGTVVPYGGQGGRAGKIQVTGKITADKNNFIANIRNADNYYSRNEEFLVIGR